MARENRRDGDYSPSKKRREKERTKYHCEACGKSHSRLFVHHDPPIARGGGRGSRAWVLDSDCHKVADRLALQHDISLKDVEREYGRRPFARYSSDLERRGGFRRVASRIAQGLRRRR